MGRFDGLTDLQWQVIESQLPKEPEKRKKGYPHAPWRSICNTRPLSKFALLVKIGNFCVDLLPNFEDISEDMTKKACFSKF